MHTMIGPPDAKSPRPGGGSGDLETSSFSGEDLPDSAPAQKYQAQNRLRRQRLVEHLHRLGPAPLAHFLREVENGADIADHLDAYARINPEFVRALGGDRFAPSLWEIDGGRRP